MGAVVSDIDEKEGRETVRLIREDGGRGFFVKCDVSNAASFVTGHTMLVDGGYTAK